MTFWVAGATVLSSVVGANASSSAARMQSDAANRAANLQNDQYQQTRQDQMPWLQAGQTALNALTPLATNYTPFSQTNWQSDPGYQFRLSEGLKGINQSMAARGLGISGANLKAAARYSQDMGSQEYQNAFNRYQTERNAQLNPLQSLAGVGQTTAQQLGAAGQNYATNAGNMLTSGAAAQAAGTVGGANALTSGLGTYLNYNQGNNLVNALQNRQLVNQYGAGNVYSPTSTSNTALSWNGEA